MRGARNKASFSGDPEEATSDTKAATKATVSCRSDGPTASPAALTARPATAVGTMDPLAHSQHILTCIASRGRRYRLPLASFKRPWPGGT